MSIAQELGTFRGNWATSTSYNVRDLVKDTSTNNIFLVNTAHTSSGSQPLTTNANSAKYDLIVDAASATTAQTAAASSATAAATSATAAQTAQTASETAKTASETAKTASETAQTAAEAALDSFDDRYLGEKSSDPSVDNDGNALVTAALYYNSSTGLKVYNGSSWDDIKPTSSEQTAINTVNSNATNINTVAGISSNVTTVAGISANVTTVAGDTTNIGTIATNLGGSNTIGTVAGISSQITTLGAISSDITTAAGISSDITAVANIQSNIATIAQSAATTNINTVATDISGSNNIGTVAGSITNVNNVGGSISNVNTVASNLSSVNSFAETYSVGSSDPTSSLNTGDLFYNTSSNQLKVYNGSAWEAGVLAGANALIRSNNLSDVADKGTAQKNLGWYSSKTISASETLASNAEIITGSNLVINNGVTLTIPNTSRLEVRSFASGEVL